MTTTIFEDDVATVARYWYNDVGAHIVDYNSGPGLRKGSYHDGWSEEDDTTIDYEANIKSGLYNKGIAVRCGRIDRGKYAGYYLGCFDFDNYNAFQKWCHDDFDIEKLSKWTRVEWHNNLEKIHVFVITKTALTNLARKNNESGLEVMGEKKLVCVGLVHGDGNRISVYPGGTESIAVVDGVDKMTLEQRVKSIRSDYLNNDAVSEYVRYLEQPDTIVNPGSIHIAVRTMANSVYFRYTKEFANMTDDQRFQWLVNWDKQHCRPSYYEVNPKKVERLWEDIKRKFQGQRQEERDKRADDEKEQEERKQQQQGSQSLIELVMNRHIFKTLSDTEEILCYDANDGLYHLGGEQIIKVLLENLSGDTINDHTRNEVVKHVRYRTIVDRRQFDKDPNVLHFKNGYYNIETNVFKDGHSPDYLSLTCIPHEYHPKAVCLKINKFLREVLPDPKKVKLIVEMWGYCLLRSSEYQKAFMLYGKGKNGKSVVIELTRGFLGEDNCSSTSLQELSNGKYAAYTLYNKMANTYADLPRDVIKDTSIFKNLVAGDTMNAERKFKDPFPFKNHATLIYSANTIPETDDNTYAYFRRWVLIGFERVFDSVDEIKGLARKLVVDENEMSGLINLALAGLRILRQEGGFEDVNVEKIKEEYERHSSIVKSYLEDWCVIEQGNTDYIIKSTDLVDDFKKYCKMNNLPLEYRNFGNDLGTELTLKGVRHKQLMYRKTREYYYVGVRLKNELEKTQTTSD